MSRKRHKPEEIVSKLRQVDVLTAQGTPVADPVRSIDGHSGRIRDELLNGEIFYSLREAQIVIESWRRHYNKRPHASLGYRPPAPDVFVPAMAAWHSKAAPVVQRLTSSQFLVPSLKIGPFGMRVS